jgi:hypothetical protein
MLAALLGVGVWFGLNIASGILSAFSEQAWVMTYAPGSGASGTLGPPSPINQTITMNDGVSTGTDSIATSLISYILNSTAEVTFYKFEIRGGGISGIIRVPLYTEPLSVVAARSVAVAIVYILVFNFIAWYALKRTQVAE